MATVYRALPIGGVTEVAIKVLHPALREAIGGSRFIREIEILSRLDHSSILPLLDWYEGPELLYYVMPLVRGETLRSRLAREGALPIPSAMGICRQILSAVGCAHESNVVHRDIKPENVLLDGDKAIVADFGIARAIIRSGTDTLSTTGLVLGTPKYMSPEQAVGSDKADGRSDLYSVGCVLYEMLSGSAPFDGSSAHAIQARHLHEPPPPLVVVRPAAAPYLQQVVEKALSKNPADRHPSAAEFLAALNSAAEAQARPRPARGRFPWRRASLAAVAVGVVAIAIYQATYRNASNADGYVVFPFRAVSGKQPRLGTETATRLVWRSLARWDDLGLIDGTVVEDRFRALKTPTPSLEQAAALTRSLGGGSLVWGELEQVADSVAMRMTLYDVRRDQPVPIRRTEGWLTVADDSLASASGLLKRVDEITRRLFDAEVPGLPRALVTTTSLAALRSMLGGDSALLRWNLPLARERYRQAFTEDPGYAVPRLRFAQAAAWENAAVSDWLPVAESALLGREQLSPQETLEAEALVALGRGDFPRSCQLYRQIVARDSLSVGGWLGLGDCQTNDTLVVRSNDPPGWRFRGSYTAGIAAYRHALTLVPLTHLVFGSAALSRLTSKLLLDPGMTMRGSAGDGQAFAAFPSLRGDSVVLVPQPIDSVVAGRGIPSTLGAALVRNRRTLLDITSAWHARYPASRTAATAFGQALELSGRITSLYPTEPSALKMVRDARQLDAQARTDIALAAWEVGLLLKARQFTLARGLADSALRWTPRNAEEGRKLAGLAVLLRRNEAAASLLGAFGTRNFADGNGRFFKAGSILAEPAYRLLIYAAQGGPEDSIIRLADRLERQVARNVATDTAAAVADALTFRPRLLAFPILAAPTGEGYSPVRVQLALMRGDRATALRELGTIRNLPGTYDPPDFIVLEAGLLAMAGDTLGARRRLETLFDTPDALGMDLFDDVALAAAWGRGVLLYRDLGGNLASRGLDSALTAIHRGATR